MTTMACDGNSELLMELEDFMEEVETIIDHPDYCSTSPPTSDWLVHFNPITKQTVYRHIVSGEEQRDMPTEYATYLEHFDEYMKLYSNTATVNSVETDDSPAEQSEVDETSPPAKYSRRSRKHKISHSDAHSENKCLAGLISYSASSDSDSDPADGTSPSPDANPASRIESLESTTPIGPQLPEHLRVMESTERGEDVPTSATETMEVSSSLTNTYNSKALQSPSDIISVSPLPASPLLMKEKEGKVPSSSSCLSSSLLEEKCSTNKTRKKKSKKEKKQKHKDKRSKAESRLEDTVEAIKDKFAAFNVSHSGVSTLHCLYIQMTTRLEDWRCGKLSSHYVTKKFNELESRLLSVTTDDLPNNWTFHWDANGQRYYYYNKETKVTQWTFPESRSVSTSEATIIRPPQLLHNKEDNAVEPEPRNDNPVTIINYSAITSPATAETALQSSCSPPPMVSTCHLPPNLPDTEESAANVIPEVTSKPNTTNTNEKRLNEQLQEFALACLEFASPKREGDTLNDNPVIDDLPLSMENQNEPQEHLTADSGLSESKPFTRKKKTMSTTKGLTNVGKGFPQLVQKWQRLQKSL